MNLQVAFSITGSHDSSDAKKYRLTSIEDREINSFHKVSGHD